PMITGDRGEDWVDVDGEKRPVRTTTESYSREGRDESGTSGQEADAGRDAVFSPGRVVARTNARRDIKTEDAKYSQKTGYIRNTQAEPNYAAATAAVTIQSEEPLAPEKLSEVKAVAAGATGIPADRIAVSVIPPSSLQLAGMGGGTASGFMSFL